MVTRRRAATSTVGQPAADQAGVIPSIDQDEVLDNLRELYIKLDWVPTKNLSPDEQNEWFVQYSQTRQAIIALETRTLAQINAALGAEGPAIAAAIANVEKSLHGLQDTAQIITAVGIGLEAVTKVAAIAL